MASIHSRTAAALSAALALLGSGAAASAASYTLSYDATSTYAVSDIAIYQSAPGDEIINSFSIGAGESVITNPFAVTEIPNADFLLGVATNLASDNNDGQQHLVLFTNDSFAAKAQNIAFGTLFPNTTEESLINALDVIAQTTPGDVNAAYGALFNFAGSDAVNGPNGSLTFATGDTFTEIAFSGGQIIGTGISSATLVPGSVAAAPEPSTWALVIAGVAIAGGALRASRHRGWAAA